MRVTLRLKKVLSQLLSVANRPEGQDTGYGKGMRHIVTEEKNAFPMLGTAQDTTI